jgi:hypothetical protein
MATISGGRSTGVVSRTEGSCITIDHGQRPLDLPADLGWRRARQLSDLAKAEERGCAEKRTSIPGLVKSVITGK